MAEWEIRFSSSRQLPYYFDKATGTSQWEPPAALSEEQIKALPGAENLNRTEANRTDARPNQVRASHILYKHTGSRRPSSWKQVCSVRLETPLDSKAWQPQLLAPLSLAERSSAFGLTKLAGMNNGTDDRL
jgi:hypothetical protein